MNYTVGIEKLADVLKEAARAGYTPLVLINGEYYTIDFSEKDGGRNDSEKE